ncbi:MAG: hypothetical protein ACKVPY_02355 [Paracoccaceae bacterium]
MGENAASGGLTDLIAVLGMLFALFMIVATVAEQILEALRGLLERVGITLLKGGLTMDEAIKAASEFIPEKSDDPAKASALAKVAALKALGKEYPKKLKEKIAEIGKIESDLKAAFAGAGGDTDAKETAVATLSEMKAEIAKLTGETERARVWTLRICVAVVSLGICLALTFDAVDIVAMNFPKQFTTLADAYKDSGPTGFMHLLGMVATALAASAGSNYWHDQLDRVRALKSAGAALKSG